MKQVFVTCLLLLQTQLTAASEWSVFSPIGDPQPPQVDDPEWSQPLDRFVMARLREAGLTAATATDRRVWIRRATFDLTGLPPTADEVQDLLADQRGDLEAMSDVVDRLLASPRYGEHWGRHWLDIVRYADSDGFAIDSERPQLWRYRDYVIRTLNEDRPFDQFIRENIAGDELDEAAPAGKIAISYYRLGPWEADNMTPEHKRQDYLNDITSNMGSAFLGLTIGCARCHDHKYDPISQVDFYGLQAFFAPIKQALLPADFLPNELSPSLQKRQEFAIRKHQENLKEFEQFRELLRQKFADAMQMPNDLIDNAKLEEAIKEHKDPLTADDATRLETLKSAAGNRIDEQRLEPKAFAVANPECTEKLPVTHVLNNGDVFDPGDPVKPGFLASTPRWSEVLIERAAASNELAGGRRTLLAEWLTSPHNPIPSRVLANRIWHYHFGTGIVATPNDFGANGSGPSHPELLDYLARKLLATGWNLKPIHREIVLSRTYCSSSQHPAPRLATERDPENRLLWRASLRRLDAETIRDCLLSTSDRLSSETGGPGFYESLPAEMERKYEFFTWDDSAEDQRVRRSVYMFLRRNLVHPLMETFDGPDLNQSCESRRTSVGAPQALTLLNSRLTHECCRYLAQRVREHSADDRHRIEYLYWQTLSRPVTNEELEECVQFLQRKRESYRDSNEHNIEGKEKQEMHTDAEGSAIRDLCLAIMNTNEFIYLD